MILLLSAKAFACGGMFCDAVVPVDQAAERIIFSFDGAMLDTEVQITYQGEADDFAWVVPVPVEPELFVSNDAMFTQLANNTIPTYTLLSDATGGSLSLGCALPESSMDTAMVMAGEDSNGVNVVSEETVGPYETVVLQATDADVLVQWLQDQGYSLPDGLSTTLEPYIADQQYFVALKLASGKSAGDMTPLGLRYPATAASIPIQLTAVAAIEDLPIEVFVLGPSRAVPDNYLHVQLNDAAIDWYNGSTNYRDVVSRAADEAGGQAFATDFVGSPEDLNVRVWDSGMIDTEYIATASEPTTWLSDIVYSSLPGSAQLTALLLRFVPAPAGVEDADFLSCPDCYADDVNLPDFDPVVATAALDEEILRVMAQQQARFDGANVVTRLFTTLSPSEMTADPIFVFNEDLPQKVALAHSATDHTVSSWSGKMTSRRLELSDGRVFDFSDPKNPSLSDVNTPAALIIEDLGATGEGTVVFDGTADAKATAESFSAGCEDSGSSVVFAPLLLLAAGVVRRRRA
ncbi:hypothetical protein LBMAG42_10610 [Deltaproteobacteria bacterium]|nr:hypothetical protein LBMAG42_10610 [Deltaproteobacteria bacterium]